MWSFAMWFHSFFAKDRSDSARKCRAAKTRFTLESLEDRCLPAGNLSASLVADIVPGFQSSFPNQLTDVSGTLYFLTDDGVHGHELWKSDASTTTLVKDINPGGGA